MSYLINVEDLSVGDVTADGYRVVGINEFEPGDDDEIQFEVSLESQYGGVTATRVYAADQLLEMAE